MFKLRQKTRQHLSIGLPFIAVALLGTFGMQYVMQAKFDYQDKKKHQLSKREELGLKDQAEKFDIRKAYFDLTKNKELGDDDWDYVRLPRTQEQEDLLVFTKDK